MTTKTDRIPQHLSQTKDGERESWIYHDVSPAWVAQAKLHALAVTATCGYTFKPCTPPNIKAPRAPGGGLITVKMTKCPMCAELSPRFARQEELWTVS